MFLKFTTQYISYQRNHRRQDLKLKLKIDGKTIDLSPDEDTYEWFILFYPVLLLPQIKYCSVRRYQKCFGNIDNRTCYDIEA